MSNNQPDSQPKTPAERQRDHANRQRSLNRKKRSFWTSLEEYEEMKLFLDKMRKK